jgi:hypothetical protein
MRSGLLFLAALAAVGFGVSAANAKHTVVYEVKTNALVDFAGSETITSAVRQQ